MSNRCTIGGLALRFLTAIVSMIAVPVAARGSLIPILTSAENGVYNYHFVFASNGGTELLAGGDYFTLYDIAVPGTVVEVSVPGLPNVLYTSSLQLIGDTPATLLGAAGLDDDPTLLNWTITYRHLPITIDAATYDFMITIAGATNHTRYGRFASTNHSPLGSLDQLGDVELPTLVPEPASLILLAPIALHFRRPRRRVCTSWHRVACR